MIATLGGSVELLERALGYTSAQLALIDEESLTAPTPCADWLLTDLLAHMEDSLDAFTEAAGGAVDVHLSARPDHGPVSTIRRKACRLLGVWTGPGPGDVVVGGLDLDSTLLVSTAALEVAVHGWDVGRATGSRAPLPPLLAHELLPVARRVVVEADRGRRFAAERPPGPSAPWDQQLLGFLGRT